MRRVVPEVYVVGYTKVYWKEIETFLQAIGAPEWRTDGKDLDALPEFMGRLCYNSFKPGLNANISKIREGNETYLGNVLKQKHGSIFEHSTINFVFKNVSRVFCMELVRHRVGVAISQESLRYVRLTDLGLWLPSDIENDPEIVKLFEETFETLEDLQLQLAKLLDIDNKKMHEKKKLTSAMRRVAPIGLATTIGWSSNLRNLRHVIQMRTSRYAEEEIRLVFNKVALAAQELAPNSFQDMKKEMVEGYYEITFGSEKI